MYRIYFDGNDLAGPDCYGLWVNGSLADIEPIADKLHDGLHVIIYMTGELEMEAVLEFDTEWNAWTARAVPGTIKHHIYMPLLNEGTDVWAPVKAEWVGNGGYRVLGPMPDDQEWTFPPDAIVTVQVKTLSDGSYAAVAISD